VIIPQIPYYSKMMMIQIFIHLTITFYRN